MPTVLRHRGFAVMIYTRDHEPRHVHVWCAEAEIVIELDTLEIREANEHATNRLMRQAWELVLEHQAFLQAEWERIRPIP